ncbi:MAG: hypothetical protein AAB091_05210, partial [Elusimicrobiota bacterium]
MATDGDNLSSANGIIGVTVTSTPPDRLAITGASSLNTGSCNLYTVTAKDSGGNPANVTLASKINLTDPGDSGNDGFFYADGDSVCINFPITQITISSASLSRDFRYKKAAVGSVVLIAQDVVSDGNNLSFADGIKGVNVTSALPDRLSITVGPNQINIGSCNLYTVTARDGMGNIANVTLPSIVDLTDSGDSLNDGFFYDAADTSCLSFVTQISFAPSTNSRDFRYKKATTGAVTLMAVDAAGGDTLVAANGTIGVMVSDASPDRLSISAGPVSINAGSCNLYTVTAKDSGGNSANVTLASKINLTDMGDSANDGYFYSDYDANCFTPITQISIAAGYSFRDFRYKKASPGSVLLGAVDVASDGNNLSAAAGTRGVSVGSPPKLAIIGPGNI